MACSRHLTRVPRILALPTVIQQFSAHRCNFERQHTLSSQLFGEAPRGCDVSFLEVPLAITNLRPIYLSCLPENMNITCTTYSADVCVIYPSLHCPSRRISFERYRLLCAVFRVSMLLRSSMPKRANKNTSPPSFRPLTLAT